MKTVLRRAPWRAPAGVTALLFLCGCLVARRSEPADRGDLSVRVTRIRGHVYLVEDFNYWKTNSVIYAGPDGIVFFDATYSVNSAVRVLWKAAAASEARHIGLVLTGAGLHRSGGLAAFAAAEVPIYMHEATAGQLRTEWPRMQDRMVDSFGSWTRGKYTGPDGVFDDHLDILSGRVVVIYPGIAHAPGNLLVYFPEERLLYSGSLLSDPLYFRSQMVPQGYERVRRLLESLPVDVFVSGHGSPLRGASFPQTVSALVRSARSSP